MATYIEAAEFLGFKTNNREAAKKFVEAFAVENEIPVGEVFAEIKEAERSARWERKLEGYYDY